jgi:hypothetical protein
VTLHIRFGVGELREGGYVIVVTFGDDEPMPASPPFKTRAEAFAASQAASLDTTAFLKAIGLKADRTEIV